MSRTRARELVLVNWKGVFFERYLLDPNVTALEGDNGAGKTTVMIAAYLVLLPDLSRLRFTNLGETGATGGDKGIWGRLGQPARPSFAALRFELNARDSIIAGVHLKRKAEPALQLDPFIIRELPPEARVRDFLLRLTAEHDEVPTLEDVKKLAIAAGARIDVYPSSKAYFAALFELGVSPLRLASDEERNKYNDMLRTSMTGGISRALTSELRSFVFKEELGLSDTLGRMRANLIACRKTRTEVTESRERERHIAAVFDSGQGMFEAAMLAQRAAAFEHTAEQSKASNALDEAEALLHELNLELATAASRQSTLEPRLTSARAEHEAATAQVALVERALEAAQRLDALHNELALMDARLLSEQQAQLAASASRARAREQHGQSQDALLKSARGLANLQSGLEQLHRRAHAYGRATAQLAKARAALLEANVTIELSCDLGLQELSNSIVEAKALALTSLEELDEERARRARQAASANKLRQDYDEAIQALCALVEPPLETSLAQHLVENDDDEAMRAPAQTGELAHQLEGDGALVDVARGVLARLAAREQLAKGLAHLRAEVAQQQPRVERQAAARRRAKEAGLSEAQLSASCLHELVSELDAEVRQHREGSREASWKARQAAQESQELALLEQRLGSHVARFAKLVAAQQRLHDLKIEAKTHQDELTEQKHTLALRIDSLARRLEQLEAERDRALGQAAELHATGGAPAAELLHLRDVVGGELLARRFEDLAPEQARVVQARLGPLCQAIIVEDLDQARRQLCGIERTQAEVWLVRAGVDLGVDCEMPEDSGQDVVVETAWGLRVNRIPEVATLGRAAREKRIQTLRQTAEARALTAEEEEHSLSQLKEGLRDLEELLTNLALWQAGDPASELAQVQQRRRDALAAAESFRKQARQSAENADTKGARAEELRALLPDAHWLDAPDHTVRLNELLDEQRAAQQAALEVDRKAAPRQVLSRLLEALRVTPPDDSTLAEWQREQQALESRRDALYAAIEALDAATSQSHALGWKDAVAALDGKTELVPELENQHAKLEAAASESEAHLGESEVRWETATARLQGVQAEHAALVAHIERTRKELAEFSTVEPSQEVLNQAVEARERTRRQRDRLELEARELAGLKASAEERQKVARDRRSGAKAMLERAMQAAAPAESAWLLVQEEARALGLTLPHLDDATCSPSSGELWAEARGQRALLLDRLAAAGNQETLASAEFSTTDNALPYFTLWKEVRSWLSQRLPAQVADVADPLEALRRLREELATLERRLQHQEQDLIGASEDVARGIDVQVRRATSQVRRVNQYLSGIQFGSIHKIRIKQSRVEKMAQVLEALRDGSAQRLLFQSNLPIEEALEEVFRRYGGGRGGGHRILDYREYIELTVEVQRRADTAHWELANPTRVSTGEAIGVGAALMMVILTEWERDSNLLRSSRTQGSLRFLFLDEANRLSQDNLGVLFELCNMLDLQLLIAAPEVARADGATTYRLVRRVADDGTEEVWVSGRRSGVPELQSELPLANGADKPGGLEHQERLF